jgi:hypothetical protein
MRSADTVSPGRRRRGTGAMILEDLLASFEIGSATRSLELRPSCDFEKTGTHGSAALAQ